MPFVNDDATGSRTTIKETLKELNSGRYKKGEHLGTGAFGYVYEGTESSTGKKVAIKYENPGNPISQVFLESEIKMYKILKMEKSCVAELIWNGWERHASGNIRMMVLERLGLSLQDIRRKTENKRLGLKTVKGYAVQFISCLETLHKNNIVHRDIKLENFMMGLGKNSNRVYVIDFGLSAPYCDADDVHLPFRIGVPYAGNLWFMSIHTHLHRKM